MKPQKLRIKQLEALEQYYDVIQRLVMQFITQAGAVPDDIEITHNETTPGIAIIEYKKEPWCEVKILDYAQLTEDAESMNIQIEFLQTYTKSIHSREYCFNENNNNSTGMGGRIIH